MRSEIIAQLLQAIVDSRLWSTKGGEDASYEGGKVVRESAVETEKQVFFDRLFDINLRVQTVSKFMVEHWSFSGCHIIRLTYDDHFNPKQIQDSYFDDGILNTLRTLRSHSSWR